MASNDQGLEDENGDASDWIEIHNAGDVPANLDGWHLTDDDDRLTKWTFPAVTIEPDDYLVVFASGKDRIDPGQPLHTNFQLDADGEYLALVQPDGRSVASGFAPRFPPQSTDDGYGWPQDVVDRLLLGSSSEVRVFVPTGTNGGDQLGLSWTQAESGRFLLAARPWRCRIRGRFGLRGPLGRGHQAADAPPVDIRLLAVLV